MLPVRCCESLTTAIISVAVFYCLVSSRLWKFIGNPLARFEVRGFLMRILMMVCVLLVSSTASATPRGRTTVPTIPPPVEESHSAELFSAVAGELVVPIEGLFSVSGRASLPGFPRFPLIKSTFVLQLSGALFEELAVALSGETVVVSGQDVSSFQTQDTNAFIKKVSTLYSPESLEGVVSGSVSLSFKKMSSGADGIIVTGNPFHRTVVQRFDGSHPQTGMWIRDPDNLISENLNRTNVQIRGTFELDNNRQPVSIVVEEVAPL